MDLGRPSIVLVDAPVPVTRAAPLPGEPDAGSRSNASTGSTAAAGDAGNRRFAIIVAACFGVLLAFGLARHGMWRDELQGWAIVRHSASPWALLHNLRYEGHPPLWYLALWLPARVSASTFALQTVQWTIATATVLLFAWHAPFPRWLRVLFAFGYFPLFEYGVLSRSYSLGLLLVVGVLISAARRPRRWGVIGALLGLLALTSVYGGMLAAALAIGLVADRTGVDAWRLRDRASRAGGACLLLGGALSVWFSRPPADGLYNAWRTTFDAQALAPALRAPWQALVPLPEPRTSWWNTNLLDHAPNLQVLLGLAIVVTVAVVLRRSTPALLTWLTTVLLFIGLSYARDLPLAQRQEGTLYIAFIAAAWIATANGRYWRAPALRALVTIVFVVQAVVGAGAFVGASAHEFTGATATARWISHHEPHDVVLVGDNAAILSSVAYRLDRPIVFPEDPAGEPFVVWKRARQPTSGPNWYVAEQRSALRLATRLAHESSSPVLLLVEAPLPSGSNARLRAHFGNGIEIDERYWIYAPTG